MDGGIINIRSFSNYRTGNHAYSISRTYRLDPPVSKA